MHPSPESLQSLDNVDLDFDCHGLLKKKMLFKLYSAWYNSAGESVLVVVCVSV